MDKVTFKAINRHKYASGHEVTTVNISVDEQPLADIIGNYEQPFAEQ
ncbi:hypothetical protein [Paraglaciecola sp.]